MPNITIYLPDELYEYVKSSDNPSRMIQKALRQSMPEKEGGKKWPNSK